MPSKVATLRPQSDQRCRTAHGLRALCGVMRPIESH
ncbi:putative site-specific DNA-methyltransferase [Pseudomonas phage MR15]|uniref:Putative site-specific DNA-methyltransferase n=1 Tax=Pseudomonas phage MR15 TaxID=2711179 RepID=A0A6M3TE15_9CAUD|nr:putative site-specific DNA-methyltransferase [Pseudomonas phage MR15]QJD55083.1 putative site-specific DNA-methyltransferase [Pseudomonas phage MR13]QJD55235.1 putative site-specific DNA-methyltransferase [Pseudomonas phage MR15]